MPDPLLSVDDLAVDYDGAVRALRGVSLRVDAGSVVAVLGSNGAGKTTLLRAIPRSLGAVGGAVAAGRAEGGLAVLGAFEGPSAESYTFG